MTLANSDKCVNGRYKKCNLNTYDECAGKENIQFVYEGYLILFLLYLCED